MMIGAAGSGKSTYAQKIATRWKDYISSDEVRLKVCGNEDDQTKNKEVFFLIGHYLYSSLYERDVIYDATNYNKKNREQALMIARLAGAEVIGYVMKTSIDECKRRNLARARQVPEFIIDRHFANYEAPIIEEGFKELIYVE